MHASENKCPAFCEFVAREFCPGVSELERSAKGRSTSASIGHEGQKGRFGGFLSLGGTPSHHPF